MDRVKNIPKVFSEPLAVPLSFLYEFPYNEFEILGTTAGTSWNDVSKVQTTTCKGIIVADTGELISKLADKMFVEDRTGKYAVNGIRLRLPFLRIIIRRNHHEN